MKNLFAVVCLFLIVSGPAFSQKVWRNQHQAEAADQVVIKELQREILEGVQLGRQNRQLTAKEGKALLRQYSKISSREIKLYKKRRVNDRKLAQIRTDLETLVQQMYATIRFDGNGRGGWVRTKKL